MRFQIIFSCLCILSVAATVCPAQSTESLADRLALAGTNRPQLEQALERVASQQRPGMEFLLKHMPERDLKTLTAEYLLSNVQEAYLARESAKWDVPDEIFFNNILPYANINETRDNYRKQFREQFTPLIQDAKSPGEAAAILNNKIFPLLKVKYSRQRRRADQGPLESIETGLASCTGLSILLIDACRSVGVPARFVGTPLWSDRSGNHSWVEVWDDGWHFTGAAEPTGMELDKGWFIGRASKAKRDEPRHAIYAVSFKKTPIHFPLVWDRSIKYVSAVNVTDRYANQAEVLPPNFLEAMFTTYGIGGNRCCVPFKIRDEQGKLVFEGKTKDESFDGNDHTTVPLPVGKTFDVELANGERAKITTKVTDSNSQLFAFAVEEEGQKQDASTVTSSAVEELSSWLQQNADDWEAIAKQPFANQALSKGEAAKAIKLLVQARREQLQRERREAYEKRELVLGDKKMPFFVKVFGEAPEDGRSLFISMHGGGNAPPRVNDGQWQNQKRLYEPTEGVYIAPRAPTNTWNLWHEDHILTFFDRLIEDAVVFEGVNPNRVYLMGYSAGGDGVYQMAPRMADRLAAAAMMAGHPNDAKPDNLANLGFAIYMGGRDGAYKRNEVAAEWGKKLDKLQSENEGLYAHLTTIYPNKGHWMDREDASSLPWMMKFTRNPLPAKVIWRKDGVPQSRFYWLGADTNTWKRDERIEARVDGQSIHIEGDAAKTVHVYLNDDLVDLDQEVKIHRENVPVTKTSVARTIASLHSSLEQRFDPTCVFSARVAD